MELKHVTRQFSYRIVPKPEGGFVARSTDPGVPPLEAPTREELQQKIQAHMAAVLAEVFPGMKLPFQEQQTKFQVHVEQNPPGFDAHSAEQGSPLETLTQQRIDVFAGELLGFMDRKFPDLSRALVAEARSRGEKVLAKPDTAVTQTTGTHLGDARALGDGNVIESNGFTLHEAKFDEGTRANTDVHTVANAAVINEAITPEADGGGTFFRLLVALLIVAAMMYFLFYRH